MKNKKDQNMSNKLKRKASGIILFTIIGLPIIVHAQVLETEINSNTRQRISINEDWRFYKYDSIEKADNLIYDARPEVEVFKDDKDADSKPTEAEQVEAKQVVLKPWILPTGNDFIKNTAKHYVRPEGSPGKDFPFVQNNFEDNDWEVVNLPHDWAIKGPFYEGEDPEVSGGMGRLPIHGVAWYRKTIEIPGSDAGKNIFLDIDGAMSYAMVWLNGNLVGGWPYGYNSFRLNLTPFILYGGENQLAIRLDNPNHSSRWYTGGGIYRNVWLVKTNPVHVAQWGTYITTENVSENSVKINLEVTLQNDTENDIDVTLITKIFELNRGGERIGNAACATVAPKSPMGNCCKCWAN